MSGHPGLGKDLLAGLGFAAIFAVLFLVFIAVF